MGQQGRQTKGDDFCFMVRWQYQVKTKSSEYTRLYGSNQVSLHGQERNGEAVCES